MVDSMQGSISGIDVTRFSAEQWKSRAMYEEACKLQAERSLQAARDLLEDALFAAASSATVQGNRLTESGEPSILGRAPLLRGTDPPHPVRPIR